MGKAIKPIAKGADPNIATVIFNHRAGIHTGKFRGQFQGSWLVVVQEGDFGTVTNLTEPKASLGVLLKRANNRTALFNRKGSKSIAFEFKESATPCPSPQSFIAVLTQRPDAFITETLRIPIILHDAV